MKNIAELLKDCPKGTKLYSPICGEATLDNITSVSIVIRDSNNNVHHFYINGKLYSKGECLLFPSKENRDWDKFCPFKDGDIIYVKSNDCHSAGLIGIYKNESSHLVYDHCSVSLNGGTFYLGNTFGLINKNRISIIRFATKEEQESLFKAIKDNGYRWNAETKTLEKLVEPKFKVGDEIVRKNNISNSYIVNSVSSEYYSLTISNRTGISVLNINDQDNWELLYSTPKFKVGDTITNGKIIIKINHIDNEYYYGIGKSVASRICINTQDKWQLAKFDINTLKPFDKVLARCSSLEKWRIQFFENYNRQSDTKYPFVCMCGNKYSQCIPYEGNEHLRGTNNACDEFHKTWE